MKKTLLSSLATAAALLASPSVFAGGWSYNPPATVNHEPNGAYNPAPNYNQGPQCNPADRQFLETMHAMASEEMSLADIALSRSGDPRVRDYASRSRNAASQLDEVVQRRAAEMRIRLNDRGTSYGADLAYSRGPQLDVDYLQRSMDAFDGQRRYFADFKSSVGGRFHDALSGSFDDFVAMREIAKPLHDDIRNDSRGGYRNAYGYDDNRDRDDYYGFRCVLVVSGG